MIGLDTNVLVRFLVQDDPQQGALATRLMDELTAQMPGFVGREVLVELVWVLERAYGYGRAEVASALEGLLVAPEIRLEEHDDVGAALHRYRAGGAGFADLLIAAAARRAGASRVVTFDRRAARIEGVELLEAIG